MSKRRQSRVAEAILDYLGKHPEAQDTLAGIAEWWLPAQGIENRLASVKEAVDGLVAQGLLSEQLGKDAQVSYRLTQRGGRDLDNTRGP